MITFFAGRTNGKRSALLSKRQRNFTDSVVESVVLYCNKLAFI